ncbi:unnamed protein product [Xylocopa violacea]|uniref:NADH dehydrogenase [ubiquinone] 1 beta subcomplex subunit 11, mitochondrial n=1 Tax=Xylocopa violacea TaxID=135666 RepID=A0ABP1N6B6_XYLVO
MSLLWRFVSSRSASRKLVTFLTSKDAKVYNIAQCRNESSVEKSVKAEKYETSKPWVSYGFDEEDERVDLHYMHSLLFGFVSVGLVFGGMLLCYLPDVHLKEWSQREAHLQLRYREENGLPVIDPNVVDPSMFTLPTEEELVGVEIII